jgi:hypothetical protein
LKHLGRECQARRTHVGQTPLSIAVDCAHELNSDDSLKSSCTLQAFTLLYEGIGPAATEMASLDAARAAAAISPSDRNPYDRALAGNRSAAGFFSALISPLPIN